MIRKYCPIISRGLEIQYCVREQCMAWVGEQCMPGDEGEPIPVPARCRLLE